MKRQPAIVTLKTLTILIAKGNRKLVFGSRSELPVALRADLENAVAGKQSYRLIIADRRGRERLLRAVAGGPEQRERQGARSAVRRFHRLELVLIAVLLLLLAVVAIWK